jgi:hypothetical protein
VSTHVGFGIYWVLGVLVFAISRQDLTPSLFDEFRINNYG